MKYMQVCVECDREFVSRQQHQQTGIGAIDERCTSCLRRLEAVDAELCSFCGVHVPDPGGLKPGAILSELYRVQSERR